MRPQDVAEKCVPIPEKNQRNGDIVHPVEAWNWFNRNRNQPGRGGRADAIAERSEKPLEGIVVGKPRDNHDQHDQKREHRTNENQQVSNDLFDERKRVHVLVSVASLHIGSPLGLQKSP
jgi:hypothetical protein